MRLSVISFTEKGRMLSESIAKKWHEPGGAEIRLYAKGKACGESGRSGENMVSPVKVSVGEWAVMQMRDGNAMLFIGACGIAVRAVAPHLTDKLHDRPVLVMDEKGRYVIPILSGHMGGANELALLLAEKTGAEPVITTATDQNGKFAVDLFAKRNGLFIVNREGIAKVSSKVLAGEEITIGIERGHREEGQPVPDGVSVTDYPSDRPVDVIVASRDIMSAGTLFLRPREYVIGMGCKKGKAAEEIASFLSGKMEELGISAGQVLALASVSQKKEEHGIISWCLKENIPFYTYSARELQGVEGEFQKSSFVKEQVGVDNVCERAAVKACGGSGKLIAPKEARDGMTIAVAKREWSVTFYEE